MSLRKALVTLVCTLSALMVHAQAREGTFTNAGLTLHYTVRGSGTPVVLLSGGPGHEAAYLEPVAEMLASEHTTILLEQRGTGRSIPPELNATTVNEDLLVSDLDALRKSLGYKKWTLLGHSFGTFTAMRYVMAHPGETQSLVFLATCPPRSEDDHFFDNLASRMSPESRKKLTELRAQEKTATPEELTALQTQEKTIGVEPFFFDTSHAKAFIDIPPDPDTYHQVNVLLFKEYSHFDFTTQLRNVHVPVLILQGRQDPLDLEMAGRTRDAIPGAKLVVLERCGHFAWLEAPDQLRSSMLSFLHTPSN